jgi:hypothetical protein
MGMLWLAHSFIPLKSPSLLAGHSRHACLWAQGIAGRAAPALKNPDQPMTSYVISAIWAILAVVRGCRLSAEQIACALW